MLPKMSCTAQRKLLRIIALAALSVLFIAAQIQGETAKREEARRVAQNWLQYMVFQTGDWAGDSMPELLNGLEIMEDDTLVGYYFPVSPSGYIAVSLLKEMSPIRAYSEMYRLDLGEKGGIPALLRETLLRLNRLYLQTYGSLIAMQPAQGPVLFGRQHRAQWDRYLVSEEQFKVKLTEGRLSALAGVGPLLTTAWHQTDPYNDLCPIGDGGQCLVGCVATAAAQIMKYWDWPTFGEGDHSYSWDGDQSCGGDVGGGNVYADFSQAYDWGNMPDDCDGGCSSAQENALAELCFEVGVAFDMDYGKCGSGAYTDDALTVLPAYFFYDPFIDKEDRADYGTVAEWFWVIQDEIDDGRPMQYRIIGHSIVCDGWRIEGEEMQYHINYGHGGSNTGWFAIDDIPGSSDPLEEYLIRYIQPAYGSLICGEISDGHGGPLTPEESPSYVSCDGLVPAGDTLTIQEGVEVRFKPGNKIVADGVLEANGSPGESISLSRSTSFNPVQRMKLNGQLISKNGGEIKVE